MKAPLLAVAFSLLVTSGCYQHDDFSKSENLLTEHVQSTPFTESKAVVPIHTNAESEQRRKAIGVPIGWQVSIVRQRTLIQNGIPVTRAIMQLMSNEDNRSYRLALAVGKNPQSLRVQIDSICSEGFIDYCERTFAEAPNADEIDAFAVDYGY